VSVILVFMREGRNKVRGRGVYYVALAGRGKGEKCMFVCKLAMGAGMDV
jgi:hypothetical protein